MAKVELAVECPKCGSHIHVQPLTKEQEVLFDAVIAGKKPDKTIVRDMVCPFCYPQHTWKEPLLGMSPCSCEVAFHLPLKAGPAHPKS